MYTVYNTLFISFLERFPCICARVRTYLDVAIDQVSNVANIYQFRVIIPCDFNIEHNIRFFPIAPNGPKCGLKETH